MIFTGLILVAFYACGAAWMFVRADRRLARHARLPMQWWLNGQPTWYAPRRLALTLVPILSGAGLIVGCVMMVVRPDGANLADDQVIVLVMWLGVLGLLLYAGYLWLVSLWDRTAP